MSISQNDAEVLLRSGFLPFEVQDLADAKTSDGKDQPPIDINGPAWQATINSRKEWWTDKFDRGWTEDQIRLEIEKYYARDRKRTPFDFLKAEYKPVTKSRYYEVTSLKAAAEIKDELEGYRPGR